MPFVVHGLLVELVDIAEREDWVEQYGLRIPVLRRSDTGAELNWPFDAEQVVTLAKMAQKAGLDGVVASPQEAAAIREACGPDFLIVTPGVRPAGSATDDQSRIATPAQAFSAGATHIVVGRPIMKAEDRKAAATAIVDEIKNVG